MDNSRRRALADSVDSVPGWGAYCGVCEYDRISVGWGGANYYMVTGKLGGMAEMYCWWRRTVLHEAMRVKEVEQCRVVA